MPSSTPQSQSTARHARRHAAPSSSAPDTHSTAPTLPPYEPPSAPLNAAAKRALAGLLQSPPLNVLKTHIQHAGEKLTDSAGEVNERATDARVRYEKRVERKRERRERDAEVDMEVDVEADDDGERERLASMQERVKTVTDGLEGRMRGVIDAEVKLGGLLDGIGELEAEEEEEEEEEEGGDDEEPETAPVQELDEKIGRRRADWEGLSLTERYASNNAYIGFYRVVHDAKHPGDEVPPLPHGSTWFADVEDPTAAAPSTTQRSPGASRPGKRRAREPSPAESDDIAIERERVSLKCPLTLLPFRDPVTSTKCPHSFEREAIEGMLAQSSLDRPVPGAGRRGRVRLVKCPVCALELTAEDLRSDAALLRKVRRVEAMTQREEEEDELDGRSRRRITLGSEAGAESDSDDDGTAGTNNAVRIKQEKAGSVFGE